jgi:hypothetical protein
VTRDGDTLLFDGMNVQVANGTGTTDGEPNGTGNLIVGYDIARLRRERQVRIALPRGG